MANDLRITDLVAGRMLDGMFGAAFDLIKSGIIRIYADAGTPDIPAGQPALGASHGTLLAELVFHATTPFVAAAASTTFMQIVAGGAGEEITADASANNAGDAVYFVAYDDDATDVALVQGTVGTSGCDMTIDNVTIAAGANVSCSNFTIKMPKGWTT